MNKALDKSNDLTNDIPTDLLNPETGQPHIVERKNISDELVFETAENIGEIFNESLESVSQSKLQKLLENYTLKNCK